MTPLYPPKAGRYLELSLRDDGHGISRETLERIFDPYFTTKRQGEGTGLGLAVVHGIVKDHGGEIDIHSEEGIGTLFLIHLPFIGDQAENDAGIEAALHREKGETIRFIADEELLVNVNTALLEDLGVSRG